MIKLFKFLFGLVVVLLLLLVAAAFVLPKVVDPNDFRDDIVAQVKKQTGRDLTIEGDIGLSVFPWLGVSLGELRLSQPAGFGEQPFAVIQQAQVRVKLMPLLKSALEVDTVELDGLRLNLMRNPQGVDNWHDLAAADAAGEEASSESAPTAKTDKPSQGLTGFSLGGVRIEDARVSWDDQQNQQRLIVEDFRLSVGAVTPGQPVDVDLSLRIDNKLPALQARVAFAGTLMHRAAQQVLEIKPLKLDVQELKTAEGLSANVAITADLLFDIGKQQLTLSQLEINDDASGGPLKDLALSSTKTAQLTADLAAQVLHLKGLKVASRIEGETVPGGQIELTLAAELSADLAADTLRVDGLDLKLDDLHLSGRLEGVKLQSAPSFSGRIELDRFNLRTLLSRLELPAPETADPEVLQRVSLATHFKADQKQAGFEQLSLTLDDSQLSGEARILFNDVPGYRFALSLDAIDADRYLPPPAASESVAAPSAKAAGKAPQASGEQELFPVSLLRQLDIDGQFDIGHLVINKLKLDKAQISVKAKDGAVSVTPKVGAFYQGSLDGRLGVNVQGKTPQLQIVQVSKDIQAQHLIKDLTGEDRLSGTGNFNADLNASGQTVTALKQSLAGKLSFAFTEGTVKGFNLGRKLREAVAKLKGQTLPEDSEPNETDFSLLKGSAVIAQGVLDNQDLSAMSPLFRVTGKGQVDIAQDTLDYKIKPVLVASISGQGGEDLEKLKGVPIPVHLTGPLNAPRWRIDLAEALTETQKAKVQEKFSKELEKRLPKELQGDDPNGVQKQLEGVFKGFFN